jgi:hypothetical protein
VKRVFSNVFVQNTVGKKKVDHDSIITFEPKRRSQKVDAFLANIDEVKLVIFIMFLALLRPSLLSIGFLLLSQLVIISSTFDLKKRIIWGQNFLIINILVLILVTTWKMWYMYNFADIIESEDDEQHQVMVL